MVAVIEGFTIVYISKEMDSKNDALRSCLISISVSLAVFYHIKNRDRTKEPRTLPIFDEKIHPLTREEVPAHYGDYTPDHKVIYKFIKTLFHAAQV